VVRAGIFTGSLAVFQKNATSPQRQTSCLIKLACLRRLQWRKMF